MFPRSRSRCVCITTTARQPTYISHRHILDSNQKIEKPLHTTHLINVSKSQNYCDTSWGEVVVVVVEFSFSFFYVRPPDRKRTTAVGWKRLMRPASKPISTTGRNATRKWSSTRPERSTSTTTAASNRTGSRSRTERYYSSEFRNSD
jgi:hypothetical protein